MSLAQGPQCSDDGEARTCCPSVSSQALYHWATVLPTIMRWSAHMSCHVRRRMSSHQWHHIFGILFKMADKIFLEQHILISFTISLVNHSVFAKSLCRAIFKWMSFFCGMTSSTDNPRHGGPKTVNTDIKLTLIEEYIKEDWQVPIQNVANKFKISYTSAYASRL